MRRGLIQRVVYMIQAVGLEGWGSPGLLVWGPFSHSVSHQGGCRVARFFNMTVVLFS